MSALGPVIIYIPGEPVPAMRPRSFIQGGRVIVTTPPKYRKWKDAARILAEKAMGDRPVLTGPVNMEIVASFPVPESWTTWKRAAALAGQIEHTARCDVDNVLKAAADSLKGIVWTDDTQVVRAVATKQYHSAPALWIRVTPRDAAPSSITNKAILADYGRTRG